jgi:hypothetical protein
MLPPVVDTEPVHDLRTDVAKIPPARVANATLAGVSHNREEIRVAQVRQHPLVREFVGAAPRALKRVEPGSPARSRHSRFRQRWQLRPTGGPTCRRGLGLGLGLGRPVPYPPQTRNKPATCRTQNAESPQIADFLVRGR